MRAGIFSTSLRTGINTDIKIEDLLNEFKEEGFLSQPSIKLTINKKYGAIRKKYTMPIIRRFCQPNTYLFYEIEHGCLLV